MQKAKEVTIYDIANKLNLSPATISRALQDHPAVNKQTKKKIFDMAEKIGYQTNHFARNLRNQKTNTIGVIVPRLNSHFMSSVIAGVEQYANKEGYNLIISQSSEIASKEAENARTMFNNRVDGLLVSLAYDTTDLSHFERFSKKNIPIIFFDRVAEFGHSTSIVINNQKAAFDVTRHLISQGCRRIVHITAASSQNVYADRLQGYKQALEASQIQFEEKYVLTGNLSLEAGKKAAEIILKMDARPDAIFVANDNCAVGCMLTLKEAGIRIPEDMAVAGFNNDPVSQVIEPNLTTINYPGYEMGEVAARQLIHHLKSGQPVQTTNSVILRSELIIRASTQRQ
ncbi:MAG TPA: LacI family DNA-binding transcriptional regulator [Flavisolibacter sp.]|jgi:LacI family transcriptional regulator|nr:LacI family DNA-binding transcriptional regulator [Flavisolibacter sp.]